jgi:hypothetical protein
MKRVNESLATTVLALAMLSGCEEETLAFGEPRCRAVSCAPHELDEIDERAKTVGLSTEAADYVRREEVVEAATTLPTPCPIEGNCTHASAPAMRLLVRDGETSALAAGSFWGFRGEPEKIWPEGTGFWVGRYQDGAWQSSAFIRSDGPITNPHEGQVAIATDGEAQGEAVITMTELQGAPYEAEHRLRVFRFNEHDELTLLFEDKRAASLNDAVMLENDLLVAGVLQGNLELTRYAMDGTIKWRQTALLAANRLSGARTPDRMQIGVFDKDAIAVLLPRGLAAGFELLVLDGSGEKLWSYTTPLASDLGARLVVDPSGDLLVAEGGYYVERIEIGDGAERWTVTGRGRNEYYELEIGGFDVGPSGWAYYGTVDGDMNAPIELIERTAPDGSLIDAIPVKTGDEAFRTLADLDDDTEDCGGLLGGVGTLRIDPSEQRAFIVTSWCIGEIPLPPLPE